MELVGHNCDQLISWCWPGGMKIRREVSHQLEPRCLRGHNREGSCTEMPSPPYSTASVSLLSPDKACAHRMAWFADMPFHGTDSLGQSYVGSQEKEEDGEEREGENSANISQILKFLWKTGSLVSFSCR